MTNPTEKAGLPIDPSLKGPGSIRTKDHPAAKTTAEAEELREACQQFEEIFLRILLKEARIDRSLGGGEDAASKMYGDMTREALAKALVQGGGLGLAEVLHRQLSMPEMQTSSIESDIEEKSTIQTVHKLSEPDSD